MQSTVILSQGRQIKKETPVVKQGLNQTSIFCLHPDTILKLMKKKCEVELYENETLMD